MPTTTNIYDLADTWNDGATEFTSIKMDVTDTASLSTSMLIDLQVGGVSQFSVDKAGNITGSNLFDGDYNNLTNQPTLFDGAYSSLTGTPTLFDGDYNSLSNKPSIPATIDDLGDVVVTAAATGEVLRFDGANWVDAQLAYSDLSGTPTLVTVATSGLYSDLSGTPTLGTAASTDAGDYATAGHTHSVDDLTDVTITAAATGEVLRYNGTNWVDAQLDYSDLSGTPTLFDGDYNSLTNLPTLFDGAYSSLTGAPDLTVLPDNPQTSAYVLASTDAGKYVSITTGGVTVNSSTFTEGDVVTIYNNSATDQTITKGTVTNLRLAGDGTDGNKTLAGYGICTLLCVGTEEFVIAGAGLTNA